jgi:hypothetical protein
MIPVLVFLVVATVVAAGALAARRQRRTSPAAANSNSHETPPALGHAMSWLAVRTSDTKELISMLDVRGAKTVNWHEGVGAIYAERSPDASAFITPPIEGWTLVAGLALPHPLGAAFKDKCSPLIEALSARFGAAHYYFSFPLLDYYAWAKAEDGAVVRAFATGDEGIIWNRGRLTPEERQLNLQFFEFRGVEDRHGDVGGDLLLVPTEAQVLKLAGAWSCDPSALDRSEEVVGRPGYLGRAPSSWRSELRNRAVAA